MSPSLPIFLLFISSTAVTATFLQTLPEATLPYLSHCLHKPNQETCLLLAALDSEANQDSYAVNRTIQTCRYKSEKGALLHRYASSPPAFLQEALQRYVAMHRRCIALDYSKMGGNVLNKQENLTCRYAVWSCHYGLGNRIMSLISTFLYSILSQRVLLIDSPGWNGLFCEPFEGSTWLYPEGFTLSRDEFPTVFDYMRFGCTGKGGKDDRQKGVCVSRVLQVEISHNSKPAEHRFLACPEAMASVRGVPVIYFRQGNQHFETGFFLNPALQSLLAAMFPRRNPFHLLTRFLLNPSDSVWRQITHNHDAYLQRAVKRVGVQLRESKGEYRTYYDQAAIRCIRAKSGLCPLEIQEEQEEDSNAEMINMLNSTEYVSVFVSSLAGGHVLALKEGLKRLGEEVNVKYNVFSQASDGEQLDDIEHQQKALADMWLLSLSDVLLTSPMSTFGYTAHGLAGITPYYLTHWLDNPCYLTASGDPCFQFAPKGFVCGPRKHQFHVSNPPKQHPNVFSVCPDMPSTGIQLLEPS